MKKYRKVDNFKEIQNAIRWLNIEKKITPVIIFDEVQYMKSQILSDLKILFNFNMDSSDKAVVLLTGLPPILSALSLNANEALRQRIIMSYQPDPMSEQESGEYIAIKPKKPAVIRRSSKRVPRKRSSPILPAIPAFSQNYVTKHCCREITSKRI